MITYLAEDIFTKIPAQPDSQKVTTLLAAELKQLTKP